LGREFQNGIKTWLYDLYRHYPQLRTGRSYWAITPAVRTPQEFGKIPVGFEQDADYFGWLGQIISRTFAVPPAVKMVRHVENFKYLSAYFLLQSHDLTLVSVWNPTFLLLLLRDIERYYDQIIADLRTGGVSLPVNEDISAVLPYVRMDPARARELEALRASNGHQDYALIWPRLKIISCWDDGAATGYAQQLHQVFPGVTIQGKGLLATEAVITIPWSAAGGNIPAYTSHFLEFIPEQGEHSLLLDELTAGETYTVAVTTGGGLYRYDMGDRVLVTGHYKGLPLLTFIGRAQVVDLVGEKLEEHHVQAVITDILSRLRIDTNFVMLAPQETPEGGFYILYIEPAESGQENSLRQMRVLLDSALKENMQYAYARNIGQLRSLRIFHIERTGDQGYYDRCLKEGQRLGDIKPAVLDRRSDWMDFFQGRLLAMDSGAPIAEVKTSSGGHT
ncbi:MAG: GH3 auxin-responsive promoter family protein, partial [Candidatus Omnitrophica bacterium]|nr:GH3 auxin-responsive promoter family protein [Candidatus Omnitrophota bacterium]